MQFFFVSWVIADLEASQQRVEGIEAELARLRATRRATEEDLEQERGRVDEMQGQLSQVTATLERNFLTAMDMTLAELGDRLRTPPAVGLMSMHLPGTHVFVPTDRRMGSCYADRRE